MARRAAGGSKNSKRKAFFLTYPRICLSPHLKPPFGALHWKNKENHPKRQAFFSLCRTPKIFGKEGKMVKKARKSLQQKSREIQKKQGKEDPGFSPTLTFSRLGFAGGPRQPHEKMMTISRNRAASMTEIIPFLRGLRSSARTTRHPKKTFLLG